MPPLLGRGRDAWLAAAAYAAITIVFTWPLAAGVTRDLPGDLGDPLLNAWILAWDATHMFGSAGGWWNAPIFHPHPLTLAYSEHLAAQALQILPIYALTANPILAYNLLFLSTFGLSALGMYLFVRELTGNRAAAFAAGLAYGFAPYRAGSLPHLQVLSSAWMPFALYGFRRHFETRRLPPLAGGALAWLLQNLSSGYYLLFFSPIAALYLAWELTARGLWRNARALALAAAACAVVAAATLPFLLPYQALRDLGFNPRSLAETQQFSADVYAYFTADSSLRIWGALMRAWPKAEGALFPGLTVAALATWAVVTSGPRRDHRWSPLASILIAFAAIVIALLLRLSIRLPGIQITSLGRALVIAAIVAATAMATSRDVRERSLRWLLSPVGFFAAAAVVAMVMSFGPRIHARDRVVLDTNLYAVFYHFVPGFDGLRVPARFGMIVALNFAVLAGLALARLNGVRIAAIAGILMLAESFAAPITINDNSSGYTRQGLAPLPMLEHEPPPVYHYIARLHDGASVAHLPLGEPAFDVRYMYHSRRHWKPLVNGYSGGRPYAYTLMDEALQDVLTRPERAWDALRRSGRPTHVVVHESYYAGDGGARVSGWLRANGAHELASFGSDRVFVLPR